MLDARCELHSLTGWSGYASRGAGRDAAHSALLHDTGVISCGVRIAESLFSLS